MPSSFIAFQLNDVDGKQCLCLFMSHEAVQRFHAVIHKPHRRVQLELDRVENPTGLLDRLKAAESRLAADGNHDIVIDPLPGDRVIYVPIRELLESLTD